MKWSLLFVPIIISILIGSVHAEEFVHSETLRISFELSSGHETRVEPVVSFDDYNGYPVSIFGEGMHASISMRINYYPDGATVTSDSLETIIDENSIFHMMGHELEFSDIKIGGKPGVLGTILPSGDLDRKVFCAAYSPDGDGYRGNIVAILESSFPQEVTDEFFRTLRISFV